MDKDHIGRFFTNIPHIFALYSDRTYGNMKFTEYKEGEANREFLRDKLPGSNSHIVLAKVNHSGKIAVVDSYNPEYFETVIESDALVASKINNLYLAVTFADCPPVFLVDPVENIFAAVHCGWRPVVNDILCNVFNKMLEMGADAKIIHAAVGPGICKKCYEFSKKDAGKYFKPYKNFIYQSEKPGKCKLDLTGIIKYQLIEKLGINPAYVEESYDCTNCRNDLYFSFRKEKMNPEHIRAGIALIGMQKIINFPA